MLQEEAPGVVGVESPVFLDGAGDLPEIVGGQLLADPRTVLLRQHQFPRAEERQLFPGPLPGLPAAELGDPEFPRGEIEKGEADPVIALQEAAQVVVLLGIENALLDHGPGSDDPHHLAPDESLDQAGILDLFAQGDLVALSDQLSQVGIDGMVGHAAHGNGLTLGVAVPGGEGDLQVAAGDDGILVEHLVEIAQAEKRRIPGCRSLISWYCFIIGVRRSTIIYFSSNV